MTTPISDRVEREASRLNNANNNQDEPEILSAIRESLVALSANNPSALAVLSNAIKAAKHGGIRKIESLEVAIREAAASIAPPTATPPNRCSC